MEQTFVMIKPDAVQRRLIGEIISRIEKKGLKIVAMKMIKLSLQQAQKLYAVHLGKPFYDSLVNFVISAPVVVMVVEGHRAIEVMRNLLGETYGYEAKAGTIRGDLGLSRQLNLVHASDSKPTAEYEIPIFFSKSEILSYKTYDFEWIYTEEEQK